jgi:hypothetical protein
LRLGDTTQALGDLLGVAEVPFFEVDIDQEGEQRSDHGRFADRRDRIV